MARKQGVGVTARKERFGVYADVYGSHPLWLPVATALCRLYATRNFNVWRARVVHSGPRFGVDNSSLVILNLVRNKRFQTQTFCFN